MQFELTKEYIDALGALIKENDKAQVDSIMQELHPADIAEIYKQVNMDEARFIHLQLDEEKAADVLLEVEEDDRKRFLNVLPGEVIAKQYIDNMDSDDAADVILELNTPKRDEVLENIEDIEKAGHILDLLEYDEDTAGGLMAKELITVNENWKITTCIRELRRQAENVDEIYYVYVVDNRRVLKGLLSLKKMLLAADDVRVTDVFESDIISARADAPSEEVAKLMQKYDLVALPVVDAIGRLLGRITIDDVVDVIMEEAKEDYQMASGIMRDVTPTSNILQLTRARIPWLLIGLVGGIFGAQIIGIFEADIAIYPEMAFFIPLIAAMGGNVGVQSSAIIVQSLANNTAGLESIGKKLGRELLIACLNGLALSSLIMVYNFLFSDSYVLTIAVGAALFGVIVFASVFGTFIPLILDRFKVDPALATGPFITTMNDIFGLLIYLGIGRYLYAVL